MPIAATIAMSITGVETLDTAVDPFVSSSDQTVTQTHAKAATLNAGTTPPVTKQAAFKKTMTAGAATIDLRSLVGTNGAAVDGNGLKVQAFKFKNPSTNANSITITFGASNPYLLLGTDFLITLAPGQEVMGYLHDAAPDIASGAKEIDISGTLAQVLECYFLMG